LSEVVGGMGRAEYKMAKENSSQELRKKKIERANKRNIEDGLKKVLLKN